MSYEMKNDDFRVIWALLDKLHKHRGGPGLDSMHAGAWIGFSRAMRGELQTWEIEVARRAKAEAESARELEKIVRDEFGTTEYDTLHPDYVHGLKFSGSNDKLLT